MEYLPLILRKDFVGARRLLDSEAVQENEAAYLQRNIIYELYDKYEQTLEGLDVFADVAAKHFGRILTMDWYGAAIYLLSKKLVDVNEMYVDDYAVKRNYLTTESLYQITVNAKYRLKVIEMLLQSGANTSVHDTSGLSPLMMAIHYKNVPALRMLLKYGASLNYKTPTREPLIFMCSCLFLFRLYRQTQESRNMQAEIIRLIPHALKLTTPEELNFVSRTQYMTALHYIAQTDQFKVAKMLLNAGADPLIKVHKNAIVPEWQNKTSIELASVKQPKMAKLLEHYVKEKEAKLAFTLLDELNSPDNKSIPYDIALTIAKKTANMSDDQFLNFAKATYASLKRKAKTMKKPSTPSR